LRSAAVDAEPAGHFHKLDMNHRSYVKMAFHCRLYAYFISATKKKQHKRNSGLKKYKKNRWFGFMKSKDFPNLA